MESGINGDQNFFSRRPVPLPKSPEQHHFQPPQPQTPYQHAAHPDHDYDSRSPILPPKLPLLQTANLDAVPASGGSSGLTGGGEPDEFYREYRGAQHSAKGYTDITSSGMAAIPSDARPSPSSLRSNGNGTTPRHPPLSAARNNLKPSSFRSASAPIVDRPSAGSPKVASPIGAGLGGKSSVKEMLKRFDANASGSPPTSTTRKPVPRNATKDSGTVGPGYMKDRVGHPMRTTTNSQTTGLAKAGNVTRDVGIKSPTTRLTQRTRFAAEDQESNNTLSGAARVGRARNAVAGTISQASKSMTNLSPTSPQHPPPQAIAAQPLFGEVLANGQGLDIGYGIPHTATRRTSESGLHPSWAHLRSKSDLDLSPSSPTAWYLGVTPALENVDTSKLRVTPGHNRNHSDFADTRVNTMNGVTPSFSPSSTIAPPPAPPPPPGPGTVKPITRLPLAKKSSLNSPSQNSRSPSPYGSRTLVNGKAKKTEQRPWSPAGHSSNLVSSRTAVPAGRSSTPTTTYQSPKSKARNPEQASNASLKAFISAPPIHNSPPLRSSRPRLPVSSASNTTSRPKATDRSGSPQAIRTGMKITRNSAEEEPKKSNRVEDNTPVDYKAHRMRVQRAYTKSIHESEQAKIRASNLRRLKEKEAVAMEKETPEAQQILETPMIEEPASTTTPPISPLPLQISTSFLLPTKTVDRLTHSNTADADSPTLGIPGSFIHDDDEAPPSALSTATGTTDFDNETQTEPALMQPGGRPLSFQFIEWDQMSPEQASFGIENSTNGTINMMLDAPADDIMQNSMPALGSRFSIDPPSAFLQESQYESPTFAPTITSPSPKEVAPLHFRSPTPVEIHIEHATSPTSSTVPDEYSSYIRPLQFSPRKHGDAVEVEQPRTPESEHFQQTEHTPLASVPTAMHNVHDYLNTPVTDMEYDSSDGYGGPNSSEPENYPYSRYNMSQNARRSNFRTSHQSAWTDDSVETGDASSDRGEYAGPDLTNASNSEKPAPFFEPLAAQALTTPEQYTGQRSPRFTSETPRSSSPIRKPAPVSIPSEEAFGIAFSGPNPVLSEPLAWPDHAPPPPPIPPEDVAHVHHTRSPPPLSFHNRRPPSSIYQSSQNGTNRESRRASDDVYSPRPSASTTPRSSTQISMEDVTGGQSLPPKQEILTEADKEIAEKAKKRLFQRSMAIKELVNTESVYLKDMNVVEEIYKGTAEACPKLDANDIKLIFRNTNEIVAFSTLFLEDLKSAASSIYSPRPNRTRSNKASTPASSMKSATTAAEDRISIATTLNEESDKQKEQNDAKTFVGASINKHIANMQIIYTDFLRNSELASTRLKELQQDAAVKVWLSECNTVAKDLTGAWDIDALLVKPVQRITRYRLIIEDIIKSTPETHPDFAALKIAGESVANLLTTINELKKRLDTVGNIVKGGRKRNQSDVRSNIAKAFSRRPEKAQANGNRPADDPVFIKVHEKYIDDFLKLQIILRDVEFYTRKTSDNVRDFLMLITAMELVMRGVPSLYPEIESKWVRFSMSMRDMGNVALEDHLEAVRNTLIKPLELLIKTYDPPGSAIRKRAKRRLDYEKSLQLKAAGKTPDAKLAALVFQYEALNEMLKLELPKLFALTQKISDICTAQFINLQTNWYQIWQDKVRVVLEASQIPKDIPEIVDMFNRDYKYVELRPQDLGIVNGTFLEGSAKMRTSQSTTNDSARTSQSTVNDTKNRPSNLSTRSRALSINSDRSPSLPTPDFAKRHSGQFTFSPIVSTTPNIPQFAMQNQAFVKGHTRSGSGSPATPEMFSGNISRQHSGALARPSTGRSFTSENGNSRASTDYNAQNRRESGSTHHSGYHIDGPLQNQTRPYSGLFHSAMPLPDGPEDSLRSSRASSRDRNVSGGYNVLYLAASLFEFNISATKQEAGYPYLTYQAGEIFDVIGEKGELWLAKNQDDPTDSVGWIWSKHFARLATD